MIDNIDISGLPIEGWKEMERMTREQTPLEDEIYQILHDMRISTRHQMREAANAIAEHIALRKSPTPDGWRGIESCPDNGTRFLVYGGAMKTGSESFKLDEPIMAQKLRGGPICMANSPVPWFIEGAELWHPLPPMQSLGE